MRGTNKTKTRCVNDDLAFVTIERRLLDEILENIDLINQHIILSISFCHRFLALHISLQSNMQFFSKEKFSNASSPL